MSRRGWVLFVAMGVIWGVPYLLIKVAVDELGAEHAGAGPHRPGQPACCCRWRWPAAGWPVASAAWRPLVAFAVVEIMVPWLLLGVAEQRLSSSLTGLLHRVGPAGRRGLAVVTRSDDRLDRRRLAGLLLGFAGVAALVGFEVGGGRPGRGGRPGGGGGLLRHRAADPVPLAGPPAGARRDHRLARGDRAGLPAGRAGPGAVVLAADRRRARPSSGSR